jgi:hypothetical protein
MMSFAPTFDREILLGELEEWHERINEVDFNARMAHGLDQVDRVVGCVEFLAGGQGMPNQSRSHRAPHQPNSPRKTWGQPN